MSEKIIHLSKGAIKNELKEPVRNSVAAARENAKAAAAKLRRRHNARSNHRRHRRIAF
jgi:hypothetical protein